ncbi:MAG: DNA polymerase beta superfamily protein, partial [Halobacterium sp.]
RLYHHYRSLAEGNLDNSPTVRRALYVLRAVLYARYVRDTHRFPALDFPAFLAQEGDRFDASLVDAARTLAARKRAGEGDAPAELDVDLQDVVADLPAEIDPEAHAVRGIYVERVNAFIRAAIEESAERS